MATDVSWGHVPSSQKLMRRFIEAYESCPELWDPRHTHYANKYRRIQAQEKLLEIYKQIRPDATRVDVRAKINSMRSNYNKIVAKVRSAQSEGVEYVPTNWMFHCLRFLDVARKADQNKSTEDEDSGNEAIETNEIEVKSPTTPTIATEYVEIDENPLYTQEIVTSPSYPQETEKPVKRIKIETRKIQKRLRRHNLQPHNSSKSIHSYNRSIPAGIEPLAVVWSSKLKTLERTQRLLAEKAINDILFEASMNNLRRGTVSDSTVTMGEYSAAKAEGLGVETTEEYIEYDSVEEQES